MRGAGGAAPWGGGGDDGGGFWRWLLHATAQGSGRDWIFEVDGTGFFLAAKKSDDGTGFLAPREKKDPVPSPPAK